jgi:hypothetical protein
MNRIIAVALLAVLATLSTPGSAQRGTMPSGSAAQAILQWFTTDRSLGCFDRQERDAPCTVGDRTVSFDVYYGASTGGGPQADALAFVSYANDPTAANGISVAVAYFHGDGATYRFIKTFPAVIGETLVKGTTVQFLPGKASFSMVVPRKGDPRCCPTGHASYTVTLNDTLPPPPAASEARRAPYHAPQTEAELALANVLHLDMTVTGGLWPALTKATGQYATLFTPQLSLAVAKAEQKAVQRNCGGDPTKGECGLGYNPLTCAQDNPPAPVLYRTVSARESGEAIIGYAWGTGNTDQARYRLVKIGGTWKLDGIECPAVGDDKFNM